MALQDLMALSLSKETKKQGLSEERIRAVLPTIRKYISFWREYPDIFVEFLCGDNPENFHLFFYQRVFLRAVMRHRYAYATFPRAWIRSAPTIFKKFGQTFLIAGILKLYICEEPCGNKYVVMEISR